MTDDINLRDPRVQEVLDRFNREHPGVTLRVVDIPEEPRGAGPLIDVLGNTHASPVTATRFDTEESTE